MKNSKYPIIVVGSGIAGLLFALESANKFDKKILLVTKSPLGESNTRYAQGGIAAVFEENDSVQMHYDDTIKSGDGLCINDVVTKISSKSQAAIDYLIKYGVYFDKKEDGKYLFASGGAHSVSRILHSGGDATGMEIVNALVKKVKESKNIEVLEKTTAVELIITNAKKCIGAVLFHKDTEEYEIVYSSATILATGGAGQIYEYTTNPYGATGDGIALAYEAGAEIQDMEFVQFHPTAFVPKTDTRTRYLISEAVRGEGAKLINNHNQEFMEKYSNMRELAPRDIVTRAIFKEMQKENANNVFLDVTKTDMTKFPMITKKCKSCGIDVSKEPIPVAPAAHYLIGGIKAETGGKTSIEGLYAIGETASTGFHGANRLASNSLLECAVCAIECAKNIVISENIDEQEVDINYYVQKYSKAADDTNINIESVKKQLRKIMWEKVGILRDESMLKNAQKEIEKLKKEFYKEKYSGLGEYELKNMLTTAYLITKSALNRQESRGAHYRTDFPNKNTNPIHSIIKKEY